MPLPPHTDEYLASIAAAYIANDRSQIKTADALGLSRTTFQSQIHEAARRGHLPPLGDTAMPGFEITRVQSGPRGTVVEQRQERGEQFAVPDGHRVKGVSALIGPDGREVAKWVKTTAGELSMEAIAKAIKRSLKGISPAPAVPMPAHADDDLLTVIPIADAHIGLMAWHKETGSDYDTNIASDRIRNWVAQCVAASPASGTAIILDVGDFTHANDDTYQTPKSKNVLDVDTRMFRTLDVGVATLVGSVESALTKHQTVHVCVLPGNHDNSIYLALMFALAERYRDEPRVIVHKKPGEFFLHEFGRVMIAAHHGDKAKADQLVHFVADQFSEAWGRTKSRFLFTGHLHHHKSQDIGGMRWEQLRAVAERDAYAVSHAYTARAQLQAITYHRDRGEIQRVSVNA